jgi:receptor protein-tyrosine kinase
MIASALPGEGKTLASSNLALTLSESYRRRVLLIDADLRRSSVHQIFRVPNSPGLTEGLRGPSDEKLGVNAISSCLSVLCGGANVPDPMGLLTSERMRQVVQEAALKFDWVIIDTPPVAMLPDAGLLGAIADMAVLVIRAGSTPHSAIQRAIDALGRDRLMGVILNRVDEGRVRPSSYYYNYATPADAF